MLAKASPVILLLLAGCAGGPPPPPAPGLESPAAAGERNLFISPAGKPYRAGPGQPYPSAAWFAEADTDHDGRLSHDEFMADSLAFFSQLDTDHDGVVDGFEIAAYEKALPEILPRVGGLRAGEGQNVNLGRPRGSEAEPLREEGVARQRAAAGGRQGAGLFSFLDQPEPVTVADTDFDSRVSLAEARAAAERRFGLLDTNHDGFLTLAELPKTPVQAFTERQAEDRRRSSGPASVEQGRAPPRPHSPNPFDRTR